MIYANGSMIAEVAGSQTATPVYRLLDHLGSLAVETDNSGNVTGANVFLPFGQLMSSTTNDAFQFTGLEQDTENSSDHAWFRNYSTEQDRWLRPDPYNGSYDLLNPQSFNRYAYVLNRPLVYVDPSGLGFCELFFECFGFENDNGKKPSSSPPPSSVEPPNNVFTMHVYVWLFQDNAPSNTGSSFFSYFFDFWNASSLFVNSAPNNGPPILGSSPLQMIEQQNLKFNTCISTQMASNAGAEAVNSVLNKGGSDYNNILTSMAEGALNGQKQCLNENPLAPLSPNYQGMFQPGDPGVSPLFPSLPFLPF